MIVQPLYSDSPIWSLVGLTHPALCFQAEGVQVTSEGDGTPLSVTPAPPAGSEPGQMGSPAAQENGLKEGASCGSAGLQEPQALDSHIPETSKFVYMCPGLNCLQCWV